MCVCQRVFCSSSRAAYRAKVPGSGYHYTSILPEPAVTLEHFGRWRSCSFPRERIRKHLFMTTWALFRTNKRNESITVDSVEIQSLFFRLHRGCRTVSPIPHQNPGKPLKITYNTEHSTKLDVPITIKAASRVLRRTTQPVSVSLTHPENLTSLLLILNPLWLTARCWHKVYTRWEITFKHTGEENTLHGRKRKSER